MPAVDPSSTISQPQGKVGSKPNRGDPPTSSMPSASPLDGFNTRGSTGPTNITVSTLSGLSARLFLSHLSSIPTSKTLFLDPSLAGPLGLVVDTSSLKGVGVERMFWMEEKDGGDATKGKNVNAPTKAVVYVCRPDERWMKVIQGESTDLSPISLQLDQISPGLSVGFPIIREPGSVSVHISINGRNTALLLSESLLYSADLNSSAKASTRITAAAHLWASLTSVRDSLVRASRSSTFPSAYRVSFGKIADLRRLTRHLLLDVAHINFDVQNAAGASLAHTYHALLTPHRTELSLLSLNPVLSHLDIYDFGVEFVPLESDLLSLEEPGAAWKDLYLTGDQTILHRSATALMTCQMLWGCFPRITGKGDLSERLADLLLRQRREHLASDPTNPTLNSLSNVIDGLVIVERATDMVTPMCTQLTYAGLLDEIIGIKSAHVEVDSAIISGSSQQQHPDAPSGSSTPLVTPSPSRALKKHRLDSATDVLYANIRDLNFSVVGAVLHNFAKRLSSSYQDRHSAQTVSEMRAWVGKLGGLQNEHTALRLHTALTERLMQETNSETFNRCLEIQQNIVAGLDLNGQLAAIEDLVNLEVPLQTVLRLLCLLSTVSGGLKPKNLEYLKREICQVYGYEQLPVLLNLERAGLIVKVRPSTGAASALTAGVTGASASDNLAGEAGSSTVGNAALHCFDRVRQPLRLINDEVSESDPTDVAYVYSGYAPLSIRSVQAVGQKEALVGGMAANTGLGASTSAALPQSTGSSTKKPRAHPLVGWKGFEDVMAAIPGETFDFAQASGGSSSVDTAAASRGQESKTASTAGTSTAENTSTSASAPSSAPNAPWSSDPDRKRTTMVFFLGGVTQAEIAALRFMGSQSRNRRWLIATTGIITGSSVIEMAGAKVAA